MLIFKKQVFATITCAYLQRNMLRKNSNNFLQYILVDLQRYLVPQNLPI